MLFAHGVGSRGDLPLPTWMFTWAAAIALVVSFVALGALWTRPRLAAAADGRALLASGAAVSALIWLGRVAALALYVVALWAGLVGVDETDANLLPVTLYVIVWVGAQLVSGLGGDLWRLISPLTTLGLAAEAVATRSGRPPLAPPQWLGHWPAAAGLAVFLFFELAHPSGASPRVLGVMLAVHTIVALALAARWGADWLAGNEPFAALFSLLGAMAPLFGRAGALALRPPMSGLGQLRLGAGSQTRAAAAGTVALLLIVLGGTTFDGFVESEAGRELFGRPSGWGGAAVLTLGLLGSIVVIAALYAAGIAWTARVTAMGAGDAALAFAPSLVPIVFGYAIAHYAQLLVDETQSFLFRLSDPAGRGWDLFGNADGQIDFNLISVDLIAWIQVLAILFGHVGAVLVAHDRSVEAFPPGESLRSQFAMLLVMVAYSTLGLLLLLSA